MKTLNWLTPAAAIFALAGATAGSATTISLGASSQDYTLYGQGAYAPGLGSFTNQQGSETSSGGINTDTLTGAITGSDTAAFASGNYSFITTYSGTPIAAGGQEVYSISNPSNSNYFNYSYIDPSVDMTLYLTGTPSGDYTIPLITNGSFDGPDFGFLFTSGTCTGPVASCGQNNVGLTPGSSLYSPTTISVSFTTPPAPTVPEAGTWALMLVGFGVIGSAVRRRAAITVSYA